MAWISAWESDADAEELEGALRKSAACFHDNALGLARSDYQIDAAFHVARRGKLVSFLRGFPPPRSPSSTISSSRSLVPRAAEPGERSPGPSARRSPGAEAGSPGGDVFRSEWLGLVGRTPAGHGGPGGRRHPDLVVERPGVLIQGGLVASTRITSDEQNEKTFQEVQDAFVAELGKVNLQVESSAATRCRRRWATGSSGPGAWQAPWSSCAWCCSRSAPAPARWSSFRPMVIPYARSVLDGWMNSFRWTHGRNLVACDYLDPK